jgi:hypothetical protein
MAGQLHGVGVAERVPAAALEDDPLASREPEHDRLVLAPGAASHHFERRLPGELLLLPLGIGHVIGHDRRPSARLQ